MTQHDDLERLLDLVLAVRNAQREFFRTRSASALERSKALEKQVDDLLAKINSPQQELFGDA